MKGDFTRFTHDPSKRYTRVLRQQGRLELDTDWSEAEEIRTHMQRLQAMDLLGPSGAPHDHAGFHIEPLPEAQDLAISPGRYYVDGILCEVEPGVTYLDQPDYPDAPPLLIDGPRTDLVYLEVWERHITPLEDPSLREVALDGLDTTTRVRTIAQVKVLPLADPDHAETAWNEHIAAATATLSTRLDPDRNTRAALGNHHYRIEVHHGGHPLAWPRPDTIRSTAIQERHGLDDDQLAIDEDDSTWPADQWIEIYSPTTDAQGHPGATARIVHAADGVLTLDRHVQEHRVQGARIRRVASYKWSRENGATAHAIQADDGPDGLALAPGPIPFRPGDLVEVLGDKTELHHRPGTLAHITGVDESLHRVTLTTDPAHHAGEPHAKIRRWDGAHTRPVQATRQDELELGINIRFDHGTVHAGDHWTFITRSADQSLQALQDAPPRGIHRHHCRLATVHWTPGTEPTAKATDLRRTFANLANTMEVGSITVGNGITSHGTTNDLHHALHIAQPGTRIRVLAGTHTLTQTLTPTVDGLTIEGASDTTLIQAPPGRPALTFQDRQRMELHRIHLQGNCDHGLLQILRSKDVHIQECHFGPPSHGPGDAGPDSASTPGQGPSVGIWSDQAQHLHIRDSDLSTTLGAALHGDRIRVQEVDSTGSLWIQDGSKRIALHDNHIHDGVGPGIALGGHHSHRTATAEPLRDVRITNNRIFAMTGPGILSASRPHGTAGSGITERLHATENHVEHCALRHRRGDELRGGIVLNNVVRAHLSNNQVLSNGTHIHDHPTHGIAIRGSLGLDILENTVRNNGTPTPTWTGQQTQAGILLEGVMADPPMHTRHTDPALNTAPNPDPSRPPASPEAATALRFMRNEILQDLGPALAVTGAGGMMLQGNHFTSHGPSSNESWTRLGHCITVYNLGHDLARTNALLDPEHDGLHVDSRRPIPWSDLPQGDALAQGHTQFHANHVSFHAPEAPTEGAIVAIISNQDAAFQDNVISLQTRLDPGPGTVLVRAPAVRATGNLVTGTAPSQASLRILARWDLCLGNQTSHGIHAPSLERPPRDDTNHTLADQTRRRHTEEAPELATQATDAGMEVLRAIVHQQQAVAPSLTDPTDPLQARLLRIHQALLGVWEAAQRRPDGEGMWLVTGRVLDHHGLPAPGLVVRAEPRGFPLFWWPRIHEQTTAEAGDFSFLIDRRDVTTLLPRLRITVHTPDGQRLHRGRVQARYRRDGEDHFEVILEAPHPDP